MKNAASHEFFEDDNSSNRLAVVIPLHPAGKRSKRTKKKPVTTDTATPQVVAQVPDFTTPVFRPKKHDML